ncbi:MAG: hypothetical protein IH598_10980 [Bacteroidales bacterium]|nr:hypothetical protein [Bacteroidales bacterium]
MKNQDLFKVAAFLVMVVFFTSNTNAQNDRSLYFLPGIPQSRYMNPANFPDHQLYVSIPVLSTVKFGLENTMNYDDLFQQQGDSIYLDRDYLLDNLKDKNSINFDATVELFSLGFKVKKNYFAFRMSDAGNFNSTITKETIRFALYGNGSEEFLGKTIDLSGNAINFSYYREYAFGYTRNIDEKLNVGMNIKVLQGIANVSTNDLSFKLLTDSTDFTIKATSNIDINTSIPDDFEGSIVDLVPGDKNPGFAFDFGGQYQINDKWSVSAGMLNIGFINWKSNLKNYRTTNPGNEFVFEGFELSDFFEDKEFNNELLNDLLDSISDEIGVTERALEYRTTLPAWLNLNANFNLTPKDQFGALLRNRFLKDQNWTTFTLAYSHSFNNRASILVSNTFTKGSYFTPGLGLTANLGPVQLFLISENVTAPLFVNTARFYSVHFGINIVIRPKNNQVVEPEAIEPELKQD